MGILGNLGLGGLMNTPGSLGSSNGSGSYAQSQYGHYNGTHPGQLQATAAIQRAYQQAQIAGLGKPFPVVGVRWMIDGKPMDIDQFADELFGADTPEKTMFLLKYSK